jgi:hypothetical protein
MAYYDLYDLYDESHHLLIQLYLRKTDPIQVSLLIFQIDSTDIADVKHGHDQSIAPGLYFPVVTLPVLPVFAKAENFRIARMDVTILQTGAANYVKGLVHIIKERVKQLFHLIFIICRLRKQDRGKTEARSFFSRMANPGGISFFSFDYMNNRWFVNGERASGRTDSDLFRTAVFNW